MRHRVKALSGRGRYSLGFWLATRLHCPEAELTIQMVAATLQQSQATVVHQALLHFLNPLHCLTITFRCINVAGNVLGGHTIGDINVAGNVLGGHTLM